MAYDNTTDTGKKITPDQKIFDYIQEWQKGKDHVDVVIRDFQRLDTIANAQYSDGSNSKNPNIGDTTVAGIVRQIMRTAVKVIPHVSVAINGSRTTIEALTCGHIVDNNILNPNTFGKGFINILHLGGRGSLSRGFNVFQVSATKLYGEFGIVPKLIHFNDFAIEPGVQEGSHSPYFYIRTKMTPGKVKNIYNREKAKGAATTWNIKALEALIAAGPDSSGAADYAMYITPMEQSKIEAGAETFDIITRYSINKDDDICTFSPGINQELRNVPNRSKFGYPRTLFLVIDPAELSPYGDSRVRLASPNQNFLMALRQNVATTWLYNSKPTLFKAGVMTGATALKSGGVITATDPNAKVSLITLDTSTSQQYPQISQEITRQIQNMMGMNPGQSLGAIGDSKTGVGAQAQKAGIDDAIQQITNIIEEFLRHYVISALDLFLAEQEGEGVIYVNDSTRDDILRLNPDAFPDPNDPNALKVVWADLYNYIKKIDVAVDTTMSKQDWTDEKRGDLQDAVTVLSQNTDPNDPDAVAKKELVEDKLIEETAPELATAMNNLPDTAPVAPQPNLTPPGQ